MLVVADSSPLNVLVRLGLVKILPELFETVAIPIQVANELSDPRTPAVVREFMASPPVWLTVRVPTAVEPIPNIDPGEEAAISLAREVRADLLLIDDTAGRRAAVQRNLAVIGTIGAIERAARRNLLNLPHVIAQIRQTDFRVSDDILAAAIRRESDRGLETDETLSG